MCFRFFGLWLWWTGHLFSVTKTTWTKRMLVVGWSWFLSGSFDVPVPVLYNCISNTPQQELANVLNGTGSRASFVERLRLIPTIEARWTAERTETNLKCRDPGYHQKLVDFLGKYFPGKFESAPDFTKASSVYGLLVNQNLWPCLERWGWSRTCSKTRVLVC